MRALQIFQQIMETARLRENGIMHSSSFIVPIGNTVFSENCKKWLLRSRKNKKFFKECLQRYMSGDFNTNVEIEIRCNCIAIEHIDDGISSVRAEYQTIDEKYRLHFKTSSVENKIITNITLRETSQMQNEIIRHGKIIRFDFLAGLTEGSKP